MWNPYPPTGSSRDRNPAKPSAPGLTSCLQTHAAYGASQGVSVERDVQLPFADRHGERHPPLQPRGQSLDEFAIYRVQLERRGVVDPLPFELLEVLCRVFVEVHRHALDSLRGLVQPSGI